MDSKEISRQEYKARINKVMDYIRIHLDQTIDLGVLAREASFSPYHFHRIFTFMTGETPNNFLQRVRIEKAASLLQDNPQYSVGEVAYKCGFNSVSSFSRLFKKVIGMPAKDFRELDKPMYIKDGIRYSKNGQIVSKNGENISELNLFLCDVELQNLIFMNTKIEVKEMPEMQVVYVRHVGQFDQICKAYEKLFQWAGPRGLVGPDMLSLTVYLDDPSVTEIEKMRQDACITVKGDVKVDGEIGKSVVPGGKYAVGRFEIAPGPEFEKAWNTMCAWFTESGYQPGDGSPYELYYNDCSQHPENKFILDICIPVKTL